MSKITVQELQNRIDDLIESGRVSKSSTIEIVPDGQDGAQIIDSAFDVSNDSADTKNLVIYSQFEK